VLLAILELLVCSPPSLFPLRLFYSYIFAVSQIGKINGIKTVGIAGGSKAAELEKQNVCDVGIDYRAHSMSFYFGFCFFIFIYF
jgi:hypothetical protein